MPVLEATWTLDEAERAARRTPRDDCLVLEREVEPGLFEATDGPFRRYRRRLTPKPDGTVHEQTDFALAPGMWPVVFNPLVRSGLRRRLGRGEVPWWAPSTRLDERSATVVGVLSALTVLCGYLATLVTQTMTFAADEWHVSDRAQGTTLAAIRVGVLGSVAVAALADRAGRRRALLVSIAGACIAAAGGAFAPGLVALGLTQTVSRGLATSASVLVVVVAAEEVPAGARAYAASLLAMTGGLGAGICLWVLPVADLDERAWRVLYLVPLLALPLLRRLGTLLPESRRFVRPHARATVAGHGGRFWLLAASALLVGLFTAPASQFMNEFLRDERGYSALRITLFSVLTNTPGGLGIIVGARIADRRGRRGIGAFGVVAGVVLTAAMFASSGASMWALSVAGATLGAVTVPALGVYGPELFPTSLRGRANAVITVAGVVGSSTGLLVAGALAERWDRIGPGLTLLAAGPLLMAVLVVVAYPETSRRELEELNPEDRIDRFEPDSPGGGAADPAGC